MAGRARLSSGRHNRNQTARSVWSAWSLLPLSNRATQPTAGASSTHSIRFARHDRPCHPSVQFTPYPPKICAKNKIFAYIIQRAAVFSRSWPGALTFRTSEKMDKCAEFFSGGFSRGEGLADQCVELGVYGRQRALEPAWQPGR